MKMESHEIMSIGWNGTRMAQSQPRPELGLIHLASFLLEPWLVRTQIYHSWKFGLDGQWCPCTCTKVCKWLTIYAVKNLCLYSSVLIKTKIKINVCITHLTNQISFYTELDEVVNLVLMRWNRYDTEL